MALGHQAFTARDHSFLMLLMLMLMLHDVLVRGAVRMQHPEMML